MILKYDPINKTLYVYMHLEINIISKKPFPYKVFMFIYYL